MSEKIRYILKWTNKHSKEEGYVGSVRKSKGYFENTWDRENAKKYISAKAAEKDIELLKEMGEAKFNVFSVEEL